MKNEKTAKLEKVIRENHSNIAGIVVLKDGKKAYETYLNGCTENTPVHVFSVTKSIVSILMGIAIDRGHIKSVDQKILDFFPDYTMTRGQQSLPDITIKHMLAMTAPLKFKLNPYQKFFSSDDWVKASLDALGGRGKIGVFKYMPLIGPDILSAILVQATGQSLLQFATENLFSPLGITVKDNLTFPDKEEHLAFLNGKNISGWAADPKGINTAGWGLTLTPMDMAKIGQLTLNQGRWEKTQLLSAEWIKESTKEQSRWKKQNLPYGYLWWLNIGTGYAAMGDSGNIIYINPEKQMVTAIAALYQRKTKDRIQLIKEQIDPIF